ncbi:MAG TPA: maleylpyruvate isomerase family mycothiol-dependent enzyme [Micromonosporaceae bacterium]|jgi:uncharacterized protein (TIGR03083 family)|nr:maleylpyruvate isomerase family mycothiol-dependent enzyme [Micromonosporaceae bacterium]
MTTWDMIKAERAALVEALAALPSDAWDAPSLASKWMVRDVVAHMIATAQMNPPKFVGAMMGAGFNFQTMTAKRIADVKARRSDADLVDTYRSLVGSRSAPPGPAPSWLGETIVHGEDIFRAFGAYRAHPAEHVVTVGNFYSKSNLLIGAKRRIEGVTLRATDTNWIVGMGPEVSGPAVALVMAMTGRKVALDDLTGPGVEILRSRS